MGESIDDMIWGPPGHPWEHSYTKAIGKWLYIGITGAGNDTEGANVQAIAGIKAKLAEHDIHAQYDQVHPNLLVIPPRLRECGLCSARVEVLDDGQRDENEPGVLCPNCERSMRREVEDFRLRRKYDDDACELCASGRLCAEHHNP